MERGQEERGGTGKSRHRGPVTVGDAKTKDLDANTCRWGAEHIRGAPSQVVSVVIGS